MLNNALTTRSRATPEEPAALRAAPVALRRIVREAYRLSVPETLTGRGVRHIPQERRCAETSGGYLCGDARTVVAVNVTPRSVPSLEDWARAALFRDAVTPPSIAVIGSTQAVRLDGPTVVGSPAEPPSLTVVVAIAGDEPVTLRIRFWPRDDASLEVDRVLGSLAITGP